MALVMADGANMMEGSIHSFLEKGESEHGCNLTGTLLLGVFFLNGGYFWMVVVLMKCLRKRNAASGSFFV